MVDHRFCKSLWGSENVEFVVSSAVNTAGGLLIMWEKGFFRMTNSFQGVGFLGVKGFWGDDRDPCYIINVYSPCALSGKREFWKELVGLKRSEGEGIWCVLGDFNAVRDRDERRGRENVRSLGGTEIREFNEFIESMELLDIPLVNRKFTWYRSGGHAKSRIDRCLVSLDWQMKWPNCAQYVLKRSVSDHCPLVLKQVEANWGPKPFRILNVWMDNPLFVKMVGENWNEFEVQGWGAYVLKEKLKKLKDEIKLWVKKNFKDIREEIKRTVDEINMIDMEDENGGVSDKDLIRRKELTAEFWRLSKLNESVLWQKSRCRWVKDGDRNSKYFHAVINKRRCSNFISGIRIGDKWVEEPSRVKDGVREFFSDRFQDSSWNRPRLDGVDFKSLGEWIVGF
ncbi:uncharacterized protein LOC130719827 [Lotus japonicus]|uniref:uncharacterized protein LOC130719827 n=1 Tax=Lotus japonicus TaxID=34305 RepID=UPI00258A59F4|nr:uncharacterized protein LOC130719827 [Lotus japonicus]